MTRMPAALAAGDAVDGILDDEGLRRVGAQRPRRRYRNTSGAGLGLPVGVSSAENIRPSKKRFNPIRTSIASSRSVRELEQMQRWRGSQPTALARAVDGAHLACEAAVDQRLGLVDQRGLERDLRLLLDP